MRAKQKTATVPKTNAATGIPAIDIDRCATTASSTQTAANTAARAVGAIFRGSMAETSSHQCRGPSPGALALCQPNRWAVQDNAPI